MWTWNCSRPGDLPQPQGSTEVSKGSHEWLDSIQTYIRVTMDWGDLFNQLPGLNAPSFAALVGMDTVWESPYAPWTYPSVLRFQHPSYVKMHIGQHLKAEVEEYSILMRGTGFIDMFGIPTSSRELKYHPIVSLQPLDSATITNPNISTVTFYQGFGHIGDHDLEQYRKYDILSGLGSTGGLYTVLDLLYCILFGRSLMAMIMYSKYISPFGLAVAIFGKEALRRKVKRRYPHLDSADSVQRSFATSDFLHDFALDLRPAISKPNTFVPQSHDMDQPRTPSQFNISESQAHEEPQRRMSGDDRTADEGGERIDVHPEERTARASIESPRLDVRSNQSEENHVNTADFDPGTLGSGHR
ncbi:hypothetical protein FRB90_000689 [Tulasnella sp. 427]|nr:hypothetical protein FRB90_000689 [Tulasnella sp. 427]